MSERRARWIAFALAIVLPPLRLAPLWSGRLRSDDEHVFLGLAFIPKDFVSYAAFMAQARRSGRFLLTNDFTLEPQEGRYVLLFHWLVGRIAAWLDAEVIAVWPVLQALAGSALLLGVWRLLRVYFPEPRVRLLAFALVGFAGGLEWVVWQLGDLLPPQARDAAVLACWPLLSWNTFEGLFNPLQTTAYAAMIWLLVWLEAAARARRPLRALLAFAVVPAMYSVHGYTAIACGAVLACAFALVALRIARGDRTRFAELLTLGIAGSAFLVPLAISQWQSQDAVFRGTSQAMVGASQVYAFWWWPLTFGALLVLGVRGAWLLARRADAGAFPFALLAGWLGAGVLLGHLPFFSAYKFLFVLHVPLCIAAAAALAAWRRPSPLAVAALALVLGATNVNVLRDSLDEVAEPSPIFYLPRAHHEALVAMRELPPGNVFASPVTGAYVPWLAEHPVYLGQWFLSLEPEAKWRRVKRFFAEDTPTAWRRAFLAENGIRYLIYGPAERKLGPLDPALPLVPVLERGDLRVYRVPPG
ncbi:MAG: hypothetical protein DCC71_17500 [Proteobacteria bacterium]|nr:MAG: hypothetical protein DCC71_17500 [Pseudomonadota bacterium]